jgi:hypothetical protein
MSQEKIDALVAESQELGRKIDALRDKRRAINAKVQALQGEAALAAALDANPEIKHAIAPGAAVSVSSADVIRAMAAGLPKQ